jgi:hypothetical protein
MYVSIDHPTDLGNFSLVTLGPLDIWFSYKTPIAYRLDAGIVARKNDWGPTTGRHLNAVGVDHADRLDGDVFTSQLHTILARLTLGEEVSP